MWKSIRHVALVSLLVIVSSSVAVLPVGAQDGTGEGESLTCPPSFLFVNPGETVEIPAGCSVGFIYNQGTVINYSTISARVINDTGASVLVNIGSINGYTSNNGTVTNYGTFRTLEISSIGAVDNLGAVEELYNGGTLDNSGTIDELYNFGTTDNYGQVGGLWNTDTVNNHCFATIEAINYNTGQVNDVCTPQEGVGMLAQETEDLNLHQGVENSLLAKLDGCLQALDNLNATAASNKLNAFINEVEAQSGKKISEEAAASLIYKAQYIIDMLTQ